MDNLFVSEPPWHSKACLCGTTINQRRYLDSTVFLTHSLRGPQTWKCPLVPGIEDTGHANGHNIFMMPLVEIKQGTQFSLPSQRLSEAKIVPLVQLTMGQYLNTTLFCSFTLPLSLPHSTLHLVYFWVLFNISTTILWIWLQFKLKQQNVTV